MNDPKLDYVLDQLRRADKDQKARGLLKPTSRQQRFRGVLKEALAGRLHVGSRTPLKDVPAWVTIEVAHGGFATGKLSAEAELSPFEVKRLADIDEGSGRMSQGMQREALNFYYAGPDGRRELLALMQSRRAEITLPEHAILPVIARLCELGRLGEAEDIWREVHGFAARLRMFPLPLPPERIVPEGESAPAVLRTAAEVAKSLRGKRPNRSMQGLKEAVLVWAPFTDEVVTLLLRASEVSTSLQHLAAYAKVGLGREEMAAACDVGARTPADWEQKAQRLLSRYAQLLQEHPLCKKVRKPGESLPKFVQRLKRAIENGMDPALAKDCARLIMHWSAKHGLPGGPRHRRLRQEQEAPCLPSLYADRAHAVAARIADTPEGAGLRSLEAALAPMARAEATEFGVLVGEPVPAMIARALEQCIEAPLETHLAEGRVSSAEVLAAHLTETVAIEFASAIEDPILRSLAKGTYVAFRRRRSVLLQNLERQVQLEELPWMKAITEEASGAERRMAPFSRAAQMALDAFPGTPFPNPLLREFARLHPDPKAPWVEEIAADIFEGRFSAKWVAAGRRAGEIFGGTLYARYYGVPYDEVAVMDPSVDDGPAAFVRVCQRLAGGGSAQFSAAANGRIIEQALVVTGGNLALAVRAGGEHGALGGNAQERLRSWTEGAFMTAITSQGVVSPERRERLLGQRRAASAWRQMVAFLALLDGGTQLEFLDSGKETIGRLSRPNLRAFWDDVHDGLVSAYRAGSTHGPAPFLGWE